jgi:Flp pilus assembly protein TadD
MATTQETLAQGWRCQQAGDLPRAEQLYRQAGQLDPANADAPYLLGIVFQAQGKLADAAAAYGQAVRLRPDHADACNSLGIVLTDLGRLDEAAASFRRALELRPRQADVHNNLGVTVAQQGNLEEAAASFRQALRLKPDYAAAHNNLGNVFREQGKMKEAGACYQQALRLNPGNAEAHNNLGIVYTELARHDEAIASLQQALRLRPTYAEAHNNLAIALRDRGDLEAAVASYQQAIRLKPNYADAYNHLGMVLMELGRMDEARAAFDQALQIRPDFPEARGNRGMVRLVQGDLERGWPEYEYRWRCRGFVTRTLPQPQWDGSPPAGRTILLHAEQGLGDTLQFVRYVPLVKERGGTVLLETPAALHKLLATLPAVDRLLVSGEPLPPFDVHAALLSLPYLFHTTLETIPNQIPYLAADAGLVEHWRRELAHLHEFKVGINWQGNPKNPTQHIRAIRLAHFAPLARVPGVRLISLQKGAGTEQLREVAGRFSVTELGSQVDEAAGAFMDTAAIMKNLDLVVSSDTSVAHLAGALGVPVWVAIPTATDWRWLLGREDTPWYPTMRLFRQSEWGNWEKVFERMAAALAKQLENTPRARPILIEITPGELLDRIAWLEVRGRHTLDAGKARQARDELAMLVATRDQVLRAPPEVLTRAGELVALQEQVWQIEQALSAPDAPAELTRALYQAQVRGRELRQEIDERLGRTESVRATWASPPV